MESYKDDHYEPTQEEWGEIEELLSLEHQHNSNEADRRELHVFKEWSKKNGMIW